VIAGRQRNPGRIKSCYLQCCIVLEPCKLLRSKERDLDVVSLTDKTLHPYRFRQKETEREKGTH